MKLSDQVMVVSMASIATLWFYLQLEEVSKCSKTVLSRVEFFLLFFCVYNFSIILANAMHLCVITVKKELLAYCLLWSHITVSEGNAGDTGDVGLIPDSGRSPGGGNGSPLQYSCLENLVDRGAWRDIVLGVAKSLTQLSMCTCM